MKQQIKAVVFDYTGVLEIYKGPNVLNVIADVLGVPADIFKEKYFKQNHLTNIGNIKWEKFIMDFVSLFDSKEETKDKVSSIIEGRELEKFINDELCNLLVELKEAGFKVAIFSNYTSDLREKIKSNGISELVDEVVISAEIGFQKPDKRAFEILFQKLEVLPDEVIFIDDSPKSLETAEEIGYIPILFERNEKLKKDLKELGIR